MLDSNKDKCSVQIKAGETHPIYITDNVNGGGEDSDIIYGGSDSAAGTVASPFSFTWTPNMCAPLAKSPMHGVIYYTYFGSQGP